MIIQLSLVAGSARGTSSRVEIGTAMNIDTADPRWPAWLVESVAHHAEEGARRLVAQLAPPLPPASRSFVALADIAPTIVVKEHHG